MWFCYIYIILSICIVFEIISILWNSKCWPFDSFECPTLESSIDQLPFQSWKIKELFKQLKNNILYYI